MTHDLHCPCCFGREAAELRWDKRGKPWLHCFACGMRHFTRTPRALRGFYMTSLLIGGYHASVGSTLPDLGTRGRETVLGLNCLCCYGVGTARLRWDSHGNPCVTCVGCGARMFTRTPNAVRGIYMSNRLVEQCRAEAETDGALGERRNREVEAFVEAIRAEREALVNLPPRAATGVDHGQAEPVSVAAAGGK